MIGGVFGSRASTTLRARASSLACPAAFLKSNINSARRSASGWPLLGWAWSSESCLTDEPLDQIDDQKQDYRAKCGRNNGANNASAEGQTEP